MLKIKENIKSLYAISLLEGEGVGTAYEYYGKLRKLAKFINTIKEPKEILIAGLPEKYGLSMDFFLLGHILKTEIVVVDDRSRVLERTQELLHTLKAIGRFDAKKVTFHKTDHIAEFDNGNLKERRFDLALSSEVFQRLKGTQGTYISYLKRLAKNFAIFVPNRENESHAKLSGLSGVYLGDLLKYFRGETYPALKVCDQGYLDMPPFPPGSSRSQEKREKASESRLEAFLMKGLEVYSFCEDIIPKFVKEKFAHIIYVMAKTQ